jgi:hypothetical protein
MKHTLFIVTTTFLFVTACSPEPRTATIAQPTEIPIAVDYFPLTPGTYWVYEGTVMWTVGTEVKEEIITWRMEVIEVIEAVQSNGVIGYVMKGHPGDLAWYEEGKERSDYVIIQSGQARFYYTGIDVLPRLIDEDDDLHGLVKEDMLFLDIPLLPQKKFCEAEFITLYNGGYCWIVGEGSLVESGDIKGLEASGELIEYGIWKGTRPDDVYVGFIPGVGISRYKYNHHGTISQVDVELVEFHPG